MLGHNSLIFSFSSGALPAQAGITIMFSISSRYFSQKNLTNMMPGGLMLVICQCRRILLDAVQ